MTTHLLMLGGVLFFDTMIAVPFAMLRQQNRPIRFLLLKLGSIFLNIALVLFFVEASGFTMFWYTMLKIVASLLFTMSVIVLLQFLTPQRRRI